MREHIIPFSEIQREIPNLPDCFTEPLEAMVVTCDGQKVLAILPYPTYKALLGYIESLEETLEIKSDPELMAAIRQAEEDIKNGKIIPLEDCLKELGWE